MKKRISIPIGLVAIVLLLLAVNSIMTFKKEIPLNLTEHLKIEYSGENGSGTASALKKIEYDGLSETVKKFIDSVSYRIEPSNGLSNGQVITVTAVYDDELRKLGSVAVEKPEAEFTVEGLSEIIVSESGKVSADGYEIPESMNQTEEDRKLYLDYMKSLETKKEEIAVPDQWSLGENPKAEKLEDRTFPISEYNDYKDDAFDQATEYGRNSSQEYQVNPVVENDRVIGWKTVFR